MSAIKPPVTVQQIGNHTFAAYTEDGRFLGIEAIAAALNAAPQWQPIETAPQDGTHILLYCPQGDGTPGATFRVTLGNWTEIYDKDGGDGFIGWESWDGGFSEETMMPTHWMPLPAAPEAQGDQT